jgi:hypothetical protein
MYCNMIGETLGPYRSVFLFEFRAQTDKDRLAAVSPKFDQQFRLGGSASQADPSRRCRRQREGERFAPHIAERLKKNGNRFSYATNRDEKASRCVMTSSILLKISSMESASEGAMTSKEHSHLEQYQK